MKKYTTPAAKFVNLECESLIALSGEKYVDSEDVNPMSNHRNASSSIWGED